MTWLLMRRVSVSGGMLLGRPSGRSPGLLTLPLPPWLPPDRVDPVVPVVWLGGVTTAAGVDGCGSTVVMLTIWMLAGCGSRLVAICAAGGLGGVMTTGVCGTGGMTSGSC